MQGEPKWLSGLRMQSERAFSELQMPTSKYTKIETDLKNIVPSYYEIADVPESVNALLADKTQPYVIQVNNKVYINVPKNLENSIILEDMQTAIYKHENILNDFFKNRALRFDNDKLTAFNFTRFKSGIFLRICKNAKIDKIHYVLVLHGSDINQVIILLEEGASATFVEELYSQGESFHSSVIETHLANGSRLNYISLQNFSPYTTSAVTRKSIVGKDAKMNWTVSRLGASFSRDVRDTDLLGQGANVEDVEVFFGSGTQHFDITANINHRVPNTKGNVLVKGVLRDSARSVSQGMIRIDKGAQQTDSFLAEHTLMLSKNARSDAIPSLEIKANDVKATHSASVSQIDNEQIFYLQSRGVEENEAKKLIVMGFLDPALEKINDMHFSINFKELIERKWSS